MVKIVFTLGYQTNKNNKAMPYITSERVAEIRKEVKATFPKFKFSVTKEHHSSVHINIMAGPMDFGTKHEGVNHFYISEHYADRHEIRDILLKIYSIANKGNGTLVEDGDYGMVPNFYVNIAIGQWNKPYVKR